MQIRAPRGFRFVVSPKTGTKRLISIDLVKSKTGHVVGGVDLEWISSRGLKFDPKSQNPCFRRFETHSDIEEGLRGKGYGILMYAKAILVGQSRGLRVVSTRYSSTEAVRVWKSKRLRKMFRIKKRDERYVVLGLKTP